MLKSLKVGVLALVVAGFACKSTADSNPPGDGQNPAIADGTDNSGAGVPVDSVDPQTTVSETAGGQAATTADPNRFIGPQISHSKGQAGGVVLLYPRIIPSSLAEENSPLASQIQQHVKTSIERALPGRPIDVRPRPERVCPQDGCDGMPINVLFNRNGNSCIVVALIGTPGSNPIKLMPWAGAVEFKSDTVPHRDPPENQVVIKDFVPCDAVIQAMTDNDSFVEAAISSYAGTIAPAPAPAPAPSSAKPPTPITSAPAK